MPIRAAGGLLWRDDGQLPVVALVHRARHDDWSLPKGKLDEHEHRLLAACREVVEETGFTPVLGRRLPRQRYLTPDGPKVVDYWAMRAAGGSFVPGDEVDELRWLEPPAAAMQLSYERDRDVLSAFLAAPRATATVLLVRHGRAGSRSAWSGDDDLRPLDAAGAAQAERLRGVLVHWAPNRVSSADRTRCVQTVAPLAADLDVPVGIDAVLSEEAVSADPDAGVRRVRAVAAEGGVSAVCSQGGAIPRLLGRIAAEDGVRLSKLAARKGSVWALEFTGTRLLAGDYYPHFNG